MITREHLTAAIAAVSAVNPEHALGLKALLDAARIAAPRAAQARDHEAGTHFFHYYFDGQRVNIPKTAFVARSIPALEQSLVFKLGELRGKQALAAAWVSGNVRQLAGEIRQTGAGAIVAYELQRLPRRPDGLDTPGQMPDPASPGPHFSGTLAGGQQARFIPLPLNRETLVQIAGQRFEFFDVRFVLESWADGTLPWIFACVVQDQILGLVKLKHHRQAANHRLEICYIARRMPSQEDIESSPKGVGTFLLAGVWVLWQAFVPEARHIFLDGEVGARRFYLDSGFREQRLCRFVLKTPRGYLLSAIADMADDVRRPVGRVQERLEGLIDDAVKTLQKQPKNRQRPAALTLVKRSLLCHHQPYPATTALSLLLKNETRIPEAATLIDLATRTGRVHIADETPEARTTVLVVDDPRFALHLENVFHLESPKRFKAFQHALAHPSVAGRWHWLMIEPAKREQLLWVHTSDYLDRLEKTAGRRLVTLDRDTQTTAHSWEVACLAVGGVFGLLDGICGGRALRGMAAVRPPGHHAEADRAMGFCLLNNVALGARYLQKVHGLDRIMIVDLDAHHGNGTQAVFYEDDSVLYVSPHRFPAYPGTGNFGEIGKGRGRGFTVNIPLPRGSGDKDYIELTRRIIAPLAQQYQPDFILMSLGFDLYQHDRLGGMQVTPEGYGTLSALLIHMAEAVCGGRIAFVLEGGYSVKGIEECGLRFLQQLCASDTQIAASHNLPQQRSLFVSSPLSKVIEIQKPFWPDLT